MITIRKSEARGATDLGWLRSRHSFSFGRYIDRAHMGFGPMRVLNDDIVAPSKGFGTHPHDNMEIVTYVISGTLAHKDSTGNEETIRAGELQRMSAGSGLTHSEYNASDSEPVHLYQMWFFPRTQDAPPSYGQLNTTRLVKDNALTLVMSGNAQDAADDDLLYLDSDVDLYIGRLKDGASLSFSPARKRQWMQLVSGTLTLNDNHLLGEGDSAAIEATQELRIESKGTATYLLMDMA